jgi:lipoprotein-anchoring transpeptidase ErfK/SrfK
MRLPPPSAPIHLTRRAFGTATGAFAVSFAVTGCATTAGRSSTIDPAYQRTVVRYQTREHPGTIIVDSQNYYLYVVQRGGEALRYGVGVGGEGFAWWGIASVRSKQEWPDWYPPPEMLARKPELRKQMTELPSGLGMRGGPENPLGARALYLWQGNKDTLYRIHGTNEPETIGRNVSSGCIRLTNDDIVDLYDRTAVGTKVVVLQPSSFGRSQPSAALRNGNPA